MKNLPCYIFIIMLFLSAPLIAQTNPSDPKGTKALQNVPPDLIRKKSVDDIHKRIPSTVEVPVTWADTPFGSAAVYSVDNVSYLTLYNAQGNYMETFTKLSWDDRVPPVVKMEFDNSIYNKNDVITFWEGNDPKVKDYYLEMQDPEGKSVYAWTDDNGKFSDTPIVTGR